MEQRRTALHPEHVAAGARMADFGGWAMPIEYPSGVVAEHLAVRTDVGIFDVSHMGRLRVRGPGAASALNAVLCNDLHRIGPGSAQYTMLLNASGGVVDDLIVYLVGSDDVLVVPNAGNATAVLAALRAALPHLAVRDQQPEGGIIAVQGPRSRTLLARLGLPVESVGYMEFVPAAWGGQRLLVCRTGYTGELGFELLAPADVLPALWHALAGDATPCGLGARDTLRTEMGYPLHGQDLSPAVSPLEAGMSWAVGWDKPSFAGRQALLAQREAGRRRVLRGLVLTGRGIPRPHMAVSRPGGAVVGETTSGTFSPTLRQGIALALLDAEVALDEEVLVDIRGRAVPARVTRPPFVDRNPRVS